LGVRGWKCLKGLKSLKGLKVQLPAAFKGSRFEGFEEFEGSIACGVQRFNCLRRSKVRGLKGLKGLKSLKGFGTWVLGFGFWVLGFGIWVLGFGAWVLGLGIRSPTKSTIIAHS
jgi:hypothetical protein